MHVENTGLNSLNKQTHITSNREQVYLFPQRTGRGFTLSCISLFSQSPSQIPGRADRLQKEYPKSAGESQVQLSKKPVYKQNCFKICQHDLHSDVCFTSFNCCWSFFTLLRIFDSCCRILVSVKQNKVMIVLTVSLCI